MSHLVITGASTGIGRATVLGLADRFDRITVVGRSRPRHARLLEEVDARLVECDLASLESVAAAARAIDGPVDVLIANAGVAGGRGVTEDGFEHHFGVNHLAHYLLVTELAEQMRDRVVIVSSAAHHGTAGIDYDSVEGRTRSLFGLEQYRQSKLANVLFGRALAARHDFGAHVVHPGLAASAIWRKVPQPFRALLTRRMPTAEEAAATSVWAATADGLESGGYFARCAPARVGERATDPAAADELWDRSEVWVGRFRSGA